MGLPVAVGPLVNRCAGIRYRSQNSVLAIEAAMILQELYQVSVNINSDLSRSPPSGISQNSKANNHCPIKVAASIQSAL